jgi:hypothetical protein
MENNERCCPSCGAPRPDAIADCCGYCETGQDTHISRYAVGWQESPEHHAMAVTSDDSAMDWDGFSEHDRRLAANLCPNDGVSALITDEVWQGGSQQHCPNCRFHYVRNTLHMGR